MTGTTEDGFLVEQFRRGDESAFAGIIELYSADVAELANRLLGWPGDVEDIMQDIFFAAFLGLKKFRCDCSLKTWLFTITINKCRSYRYKRLLHIKSFSKISVKTSGSVIHAADQSTMDTEIYERIRQAVAVLPAKYREPIVLKYLQELPTEQIGQILGLSQNALHVRLSRAREQLRKNLSGFIEK
jgi:RNA polymerase sigma-70 factor (ECF subfamily)